MKYTIKYNQSAIWVLCKIWKAIKAINLKNFLYYYYSSCRRAITAKRLSQGNWNQTPWLVFAEGWELMSVVEELWSKTPATESLMPAHFWLATAKSFHCLSIRPSQQYNHDPTCQIYEGYEKEKLRKHFDVIESLRLERPLRSLSPAADLAPLCSPLNHVPKSHMQMPFEHFQGKPLWNHNSINCVE